MWVQTKEQRQAQFQASASTRGPPESQPIPPLSHRSMWQWINNRCDAVIGVNRHKHTATCQKYWERIRKRFKHARYACRFGYPHRLQPQSTVTEKLGLDVTRLSHRINPYNPVLLACFGTNSDVKTLWGGDADSMAAVFYSTNYSTKLKKSLLDQFPVLKLRIKVYRDKKAAGFYDGKTEMQEQCSIISSLMFALQAEVVISILSVVHLLLGYAEYEQPDTYRKATIYPGLEEADDYDLDTGYGTSYWQREDAHPGARGERLQVGKGGILKGSSLDYKYRPIALKDWSFYDFKSYADKVRRDTQTALPEFDDYVRFELHPDHPEFNSSSPIKLWRI
jgi:hypothetical protein